MAYKIKWQESQPNIGNKEDYPLDEKNMIRMVKWASGNCAVFYNKSRKEVEESFAVRLDVMEEIEFEINQGNFYGYEVPLKNNECYMESPNAELGLIAKRVMGEWLNDR
jgi:hypothetical protein